VDDRRGGGRDHRGADVGIGRAARVWDRLSDRGSRGDDRDLYIAQDAIRTLLVGDPPSTSWVGVGLSISSIIAMPLLGRAKQRVGERLGSGATAGEGTQNLLCAYMAAGVLIGLVANTVLGWWWLDPLIGLLIAALAVREGRQTWSCEGCGCAALPSPDTDSCRDGCC
jgi:hypothetical protein